MDMFAALPKGLCVYFEAVGSRIAGSKRRFYQGVRPVRQGARSAHDPDVGYWRSSSGAESAAVRFNFR